MLVKNYEKVAGIYSKLMNKISYKDWADYIADIYKYCKIPGKRILELGAGNGKVAEHLSKKIANVTITDLSISMLKLGPSHLTRICCDMTALPIRREFDFIYSTFDSVNYILTEEGLKKLLEEVRKILSPNGVFTFDASLEKNSLLNYQELNRSGRYKGIQFQQVSSYNVKSRLHTNKFYLSFPNGQKFEEVHEQKIYDFITYFDLIDLSNLYVSDCFEVFTFEDADKNSERVQFVVRKINQ